MPFAPTASRLWRHQTPEDRLAAARRFWESPPQELLGSALATMAKSRHLRPQVARGLDAETRARYLAGVLDPGESLAAALMVALHLGDRRPMLATFLDAAGLPHEGGLLKDEADALPPLSTPAAQQGVDALRAAYPETHVEAYLNTLWLQDPERWKALAELCRLS